MHANVVVKDANENDGRPRPADGSHEPPPRIEVPSKHPQSGISHMYNFFGPLWTAMPTLKLSPPTRDERRACLSESVPISAGKQLTDKEIEELLEEWTANPFGVETSSVRDMGWYPGRFDPTSGAERAKWGGWYPEVSIANEDMASVNDSDLSDHLPLPSYPLRPQGIYAPVDDDNVAASLEGAVADPADVDTALPTPPPPFQTGNFGASAGSAAESRARSLTAIGSVKLKIGQINANTEKRDEEEVELPRFSAARLDEYIPRKPGHVFNAGGAIRAVKWAPRADGPSDKEYLAVTTVSNPEAPLCHVSPSSGGSYARSRSMIQLWSIPCNPARDELNYELPDREETQPPRGRMKLEVGLCVDGDVGEIAWCPRGGSSNPQSATSGHEREDGEQEDVASSAEAKGKGRGKGKGTVQAGKENQTAAAGDEARVDPGGGTVTELAPHLGVLAAVMADGALSFFAIPDPRQTSSASGADPAEPSAPSFVKIEPLFRLRLPSSTILSVAWGDHETVAVGCTDGTIAIWRVGDAIRSRGRGGFARPTHLVRAHSGVIRSLVFVPSPQPFITDQTLYDDDKPPSGLVAVGYDGVSTLCDLRAPDLAVTSLYQQRAPINHVAFSAVSGMVYTHDGEDRVKGVFLKPSVLGSEARIAIHRGPVWSLAASPHHGLVVSTSSDGTAMLSSGIRALRRRRVRGHFTQKLFRFDFKRETGELRMWDNLDVEHRQALDPSNFARTAKKGTAAEAADQDDSSTAAWAPEQGVLCSDWHSSIDRCALLATGTANGLGRIDWVEGTAQATKAAASGASRSS